MKRLIFAASVALSLALVGCGGSAGAGGAAALPGAGTALPTTDARVVITIPQRAGTSAGSRAPAYVSPSTQSLTVAIDGGTPTAQNLTPGSPNCSVGGPLSALTCTVPIAATPGSHTFTFTTYDGLGGTGNALSTNAVTQTIVANQTNSIDVTLAGVPVSLQVFVLGSGTGISGIVTSGLQVAGAVSIPLSVAPLDADGNIIIGPGAPTLAASITGATPGLGTTVAPNAANPNEFTVSALAAGSGTFSVTATPATASAGSPLSATVPLTFETLTTTIAGKPFYPGLFDGTGTSVRFKAVAGITYDSATGDLYVTDTANCAVRSVTPGNGTANSGTVVTLAGSPACGLADGTGASARFYNPIGDAYDPANGYIYVTDLSNCAIRQLAPGSGTAGSGTVVTVAGGGGCGYADGTGAAAKFYNPAGVAYDPANGDLYVTDDSNCMVREIIPGNGTAGSATVLTLAGSTTCGFADGTGTTARFNHPASIAYDPVNGDLYVTDNGNCVVRQVTPGNGTANSGTVTTLAGSTCGFAQGTGTSVKFGEASGIAYDSANGNFYITDYTNWVIWQMTPGNGTANSASAMVVAGGVRGWSDGIGPIAQYFSPDFLAYDPTNNALYITDAGSDTVRELQP
ncbi:MAG: hypothetical protein HKL91_07290 [Candidatus Eremiobacteraeota bacterium]|nr:hypothetical protein [Candidatus Eremiobacteraeota bacterium]